MPGKLCCMGQVKSTMIRDEKGVSKVKRKRTRKSKESSKSNQVTC